MLNKIILRSIQSADLEDLTQLFFETVNKVNVKDYTQEQLQAWAPSNIHHSHPHWQKLLSNIAVIAEIGDDIVGFGDMTHEGYLDRLFVHKNYQRRGIASLIVQSLEVSARNRGITSITTEASITAKPFFESKGYRIIQEQQKKHSGVILTNYLMEKNLTT